MVLGVFRRGHHALRHPAPGPEDRGAPLVNNVVALLKDSSLASVITLLELALSGQRIISATFRPVEVYLAVAAVYLLLTTLLTFFTNLLERRLALPGR